MFNELPFLERFRAAAEAGFRGVEFLFPYDYLPEQIAVELRSHSLENVLFNLPPGDSTAGDRGMACLPGREAEFRSGVDRALSYAVPLGTRRLHVMAGIMPQDADSSALQATYLANLEYAAARFAEHGIAALIEPINRRDVPGYFLHTQAQAYSICETIQTPNLQMQMDCYHMQVEEGDVAMKLRRYAPACGHIQIAGAPERHEPDIGELNYPYLFDLLDEIGYDGWVGCEYRPRSSTLNGLGWLRRAEHRQ